MNDLQSGVSPCSREPGNLAQTIALSVSCLGPNQTWKGGKKSYILCNLIKHEDGAVAVFLIDNLKPRWVTEYGLDTSECVQDLGDGKWGWTLEGVLLNETLSD